jgi:riboflavin kinase, archaea type
MKFTGIVTSGIGQGAQFLALDWVAKELRRTLDLTPFPGTLNLRVTREARAAVFALRQHFLRIADSTLPDCPGYLQKITLRANGRACESAWLILPEKTMYDDVLEIIAAASLRQQLSITDGDCVTIEF